MRSMRLAAVLGAIALLAAACGSNGDDDLEAAASRSPSPCPEDYQGADVYPLFVSSEIVVGDEARFLMGLLDSNDAPISEPGLLVDATFEPISGVGTPTEAEFDYIETVPSQNRGVYAAYPSFDEPGVWKADITVQGAGLGDEMIGCFQVTAEGTTPAIGAPAPASDVPTVDDVKNLSKISTDPDPDPRFYRTTPAEALRRGEPFVFVLATPKFCTSQTCGPTLDEVGKITKKSFPDLTVIHSEIYKGLEPTGPVVDAVQEWGLPSEPWVFVVDSKGKVAAKFEGSVSAEELIPVLRRLK